MRPGFTSVSYAGSKEEVRALKIIAAERGVSIGQLVRNAVFAQYGIEIASALDGISFVQDVSQQKQVHHD